MMNWHNHFPSPSFANFTVLELMGKNGFKGCHISTYTKGKNSKGSWQLEVVILEKDTNLDVNSVLCLVRPKPVVQNAFSKLKTMENYS